MADELSKIQTKIALLEKDAKTGEQIHARLEVAIGKLSDCAMSINELRAMKHQLSERVGVLEKWRWVIIGGSIIIGLMMSNPSGNIWDFLS